MHASDPSASSDEATLIAESEPMRRVLALAVRAAGSDATVLIQGETGTGKELIARTIHRHSPRSSGPFVPVNCGAYTDSLLASELFGHVRGAFTGAVSERPGVFEVAGGGTVFLDEIAAMSPEMQVKMLRVLQERRVTRVGSSKEIPVDVRVIAATNADLAEMTGRSDFREDLYYRIKVVTCRIPSLRERPADVRPLIRHYLEYFSRQFGRGGIRLDPRTEQVLLQHHWPGNVRQLRSEIEKIVAMADPDAIIQPTDLSEEVFSIASSPRADAVPAGPDPVQIDYVDRPGATYQELLDEWTRSIVAQRLDSCGGNITRTAQSLAISRSTLYALLRKYGMHGQED